jgi:hypothetical protein
MRTLLLIAGLYMMFNGHPIIGLIILIVATL